MISDGYWEQENWKGILLGGIKLLSSFESAKSLDLNLADTITLLMDAFHSRGDAALIMMLRFLESAQRINRSFFWV